MNRTYDVFGRKTHPEPLTYLGSIEVDQPEAVVQASLDAFGPESEWLEMVAVPHAAVTVVFSEQSEAAP